MPRGKSINKERVYQLAKEGKSASEIMDAMNISNKSSLKSTLAEVMIEKGEVLKVAGLTGRVAGRNRRINKMGIQIPKSQLEHQFDQGDEFELQVQQDRIVLKKV